MHNRNVLSNEEYTVMIAEDNADQAHYLSEVLASHDYNVIWVKDGLKALQLMTMGVVPHVLVTDIKMPTLNGFELMEQLHRLQIDIPVIVTSGTSTEWNFEEAYVLGAQSYLVKPFSPKEILERLRLLLRTKHTTQ